MCLASDLNESVAHHWWFDVAYTIVANLFVFLAHEVRLWNVSVESWWLRRHFPMHSTYAVDPPLFSEHQLSLVLQHSK